jgi:hypothetical protein
VCLASFEQLLVHHRSAHRGNRITNNWYQSIWFKVVFDFCSKMKVVKIMFWPYHCVEEEETKPLVKTASKSGFENVLTRHHAPARLLAMRHTRLLHLDELTLPECQTTRPTCQTRIRMTSSWHNHDASMHSWHAMSSSVSSHVIVQSADTSSLWDPPATSSATSRAELSRAVCEPSRAPSWGRRFCAAESTCNRI